MYRPAHCPEPVNGDNAESKNWHERHSVVKENPDTAHDTPKWPVPQDIIQGVKAHGGDGNQNVCESQIDHVDIEDGLKALVAFDGH